MTPVRAGPYTPRLLEAPLFVRAVLPFDPEARTREESLAVRMRTGVLLCVLGLAWTGSAQAVDLTGRASIGASGAGMKFVSGEDFKNGSVRLLGQAVFKYNFTEHLAGVAETGWGWNAYEDAELETLAVVVPTTLGVEYRFHAGSGKLWPHFAGGGGLYWLGIKNDPDQWAQAGDGAETLRWTSPGLYGKAGVEYIFDDGVALNLDFLYHAIFSENPERYTFTQDLPPGDPGLALDNGWGLQNTSFAEIRFGVNYYFSLGGSSPAPPEEEE